MQKVIKTSDYGSILVYTPDYHEFKYHVSPNDPQQEYLWAEAKRLAYERAQRGEVYKICYPYRFNDNEINRKGEAMLVEPAKPTITVDMVVDAYVKTRDELAELKKKFEEEESKLRELQDRRADWLLQQLDAIGVQNMKSGHGTVYKMRKESVTMGDWDSFFAYVTATQQYNLLQHGVNKTAALEVMGDNRENTPPPGVNYVAIQTVGVRRN